MIQRRKTRVVRVGGVSLGGPHPVAVQSMTTTHTRDIKPTMAQIRALAAAGADLVRVAVLHQEDTAALKTIVQESPVPVIADVHFHFRRALEAVEAGAHKIRLNPGNIKDRAQVNEVIAACKAREIPIRVGVNEGSVVERADKKRRDAQKRAIADDPRRGLVNLMLKTLEEYLRIFDENDFHDVVISAKGTDPAVVIEAYRAISDRCDCPLHIGLTHAGPPETGRIRSVAALSTLLSEGIGDTIRISYAADPLYEVQDAKELLCCLGLRPRTEPELIACPTCGRIEVDLIQLVAGVRRKLADIKVPIKVAVMGCMVNGPGEAEGADVAIFAGKGSGMICVEGRQVRTVPEADMLQALYEEAVSFAARVEAGQARLSNQPVMIADSPD